MEQSGIQNIVIVGAGNVGTHLIEAFLQTEYHILQVVTQSSGSAERITESYGIPATSSAKEMISVADLYLLSVPDHSLPEVVQEMNFHHRLVAHTSGSVGMEVLLKASENHGVFYPLQTFTRNKPLDFLSIPVCIEANTPENGVALAGVAAALSDHVVFLDSGQRRVLHIAAVFACNFVNHMYHIAANILEENKLPFDLLLPLIKETADKAGHGHPSALQTGPALRNDMDVIDKHNHYLERFPGYKKLYNLITKNIVKEFKAKKRNGQL